MPIPGAKYRFTKTKKGKAVRLAFVDNKAVEAMSFKKNKEGILKKQGKVKRSVSSLAGRMFS